MTDEQLPQAAPVASLFTAMVPLLPGIPPEVGAAEWASVTAVINESMVDIAPALAAARGRLQNCEMAARKFSKSVRQTSGGASAPAAPLRGRLRRALSMPHGCHGCSLTNREYRPSGWKAKFEYATTRAACLRTESASTFPRFARHRDGHPWSPGLPSTGAGSVRIPDLPGTGAGGDDPS